MKRKQLILIGAVAVLALIGFIAWQVGRQQANQNKTYQPLSEVYGEDKQETQFLNTGELVDQGATDDQITSMEAAFKKFAPEAKQIIVFSTTVKTDYNIDDPNATPAVRFTVTIDNTTYQAKLEYHTVTSYGSIRLYLFDQDGKQVYDSGVFDSQAQNAN